MLKYFTVLLATLWLQSFANSVQTCTTLKKNKISTSFLNDITILASDDMQGRASGTKGSLRAQDFIAKRFKELSLNTFNSKYRHDFIYRSDKPGSNMIGWMPGSHYKNKYVVVSAHYDHLGMRGRRIYNGANDNASGVAALFALAGFLQQHPPRHNIIFLATDAEEIGLHGANAFLKNPPVPIDHIRLNINVDMIAPHPNNGKISLWTNLNTAMYKELKSHLNTDSCLKVNKVKKKDKANISGINWHKAGDHYAFYQQKIPFVFLSSKPQRHYHRATDTVEKISTTHLANSIQSLFQIVTLLDSKLGVQLER